MSGSVDLESNLYIYGDSGATISGSVDNKNGSLLFFEQGAFINLSGNAFGSISPVEMNSTQLQLKQTINQLLLSADSQTPTATLGTIDSNVELLGVAPATGIGISTFTIDHLLMGKSDILKIVGSANTIIVLKILGSGRFGGPMVLVGIPASNILIYVTDALSTESVSISGDNLIFGTFLVPNRLIDLKGNGSFVGALISSQAITITGNGGGTAAVFKADAFCVKAPAP